MSSTQDGLIYPELYDKIFKLVELDNHKKLSDLRLTDDKPYFYYFRSGDRLLKFTTEGDDVLRIEIDRANLIRRLLTRNSCVGVKGKQGATGLKGINGKPAIQERFRPVDSNTGELDIDVEIPLEDNPISLRVYNKNDKLFIGEILIELDGSFSDEEDRWYVYEDEV